MKNAIPWVAFAVLLALGARAVFPKVVTVPGIPVIVTDTQYVDRVVIEEVERVIWRDRVTTDTVRLVHEVLISQPVYVPGPELPRTRGITRLSVGESHGDTTTVAYVDMWGDGAETAVQRSVEKLFTPGPLLYLEASDPVRADFGTFEQSESCGFGCKMLWAAGGLAAGIVVWELAR